MAIFDTQERLIGVVTCMEDAYRLVTGKEIESIDEKN